MTESVRSETGDILVRISPRRPAAAHLLVPLSHRLRASDFLLWIGSDPACGLKVPDLRPRHFVVRRISVQSVAIQDHSGGGIRYHPLGREHPTVSNAVVVRMGEGVTVERYAIDILPPP